METRSHPHRSLQHEKVRGQLQGVHPQIPLL